MSNKDMKKYNDRAFEIRKNKLKKMHSTPPKLVQTLKSGSFTKIYNYKNCFSYLSIEKERLFKKLFTNKQTFSIACKINFGPDSLNFI